MTLSGTRRRFAVREELTHIARNIRDLRENPGTGGRRDYAARMAVDAWKRLAAVTGNPDMGEAVTNGLDDINSGLPAHWPWGPDAERVRTCLDNLLQALNTAPGWEDELGDGWMTAAWDDLADVLGEERLAFEESPEQPAMDQVSIGTDPCRGLTAALFHARRAEEACLELAGKPHGRDAEERHRRAERDARLAHRLLRLTHRRLADELAGARRSEREAMKWFIQDTCLRAHERLMVARRAGAFALGIIQREPDGLESVNLW